MDFKSEYVFQNSATYIAAMIAYRIDQNIRCGGTKTCSTGPYIKNRWTDLVI